MRHMMRCELMQRNLLARRHFCHCISWTIETNVPSHLDFSQGCTAIDYLSHCGACVCGYMRPPSKGWDVFPTAQEARRVLHLTWNRVERLWVQAEVATRRVEQTQQQGHDARGVAAMARSAWRKVETAFDQFEGAEVGWKRAHSALQVFRPDGRLNERGWARAQLALALPTLSGREWSKVRGFLQAEETFTFLDRMHRQLPEAQPDEEWLGDLVRLGWLRRQCPRGSSSGSIAGSGHVAHLVQMVACHHEDANWRESYQRVARVLRRTVRARSAVECMNSVLRMHQARHRTVTQELLDLKRLYWNCRVFREGKRRGRCPYEHLGLKRPSYSFWKILQMPTPTPTPTA